MKPRLWAAPAIGLLLVPLVVAQANVGVSLPAKRHAPSTAVKPSTNCRPEPTVNANGELEFTGCAEKAEHVDRSTFDRPAGSAAGAWAASSTAMDPDTRAKQQAALTRCRMVFFYLYLKYVYPITNIMQRP